MKLYINRKPIEGPWGGGNNFIKSIYNYLPELNWKIIDNPYAEIPDVIFLQSPKPDNTSMFSINDALSIKAKYPDIKIVLRVNDCDARKATVDIDTMWRECSKHVDKIIFVSNWIKQYFIDKGWYCNDNSILYNGVDLDIFKKRKKNKNGKIDIVTHHWSNNRMKGFDIYEKLDDFIGNNVGYTFTYIGRELGSFNNTKVISPLFGKQLGEELSKYDVYVSGSLYDPGPNHILESLACEIPTFSYFKGGGACEFTGQNYTFKNFEEFMSKIKSNPRPNRNIKIKDWKSVMIEFSNLLKQCYKFE